MSWLEIEVLDSTTSIKANGKQESTAAERDVDMEAQTRPSMSDNGTEITAADDENDEESAPLIKK